MTKDYWQWLKQRLDQQRKQGRWRRLHTLTSAQGCRVQVDGTSLLNFSSNDYLSLANHPQVIDAFKQGLDRYGCGSGASHLISGHSEAHEQLAHALAEWLGYESVTLFSSGYMANTAMLHTLLDSEDLIVQDKLNHASLIDAALSSQAQHRRFRHADCDSLAQQLATPARFKAVVTDGVFSMDGDIAPLADYWALLSTQPNNLLMVDDAHGLGVLGNSGAGTREHLKLSSAQVTATMATLGKALGTAGAFIAADHTIGETLRQFARPYIYTTAMPPALAYATLASVKLARLSDGPRAQLISNVRYFQTLVQQTSLPVMSSDSAIQPILVGDDAACMACGEFLKQRGFWVGTIRPPTVPKGTARLRITLNAEHSFDDIEQLIVAVSDWFRQQPNELSFHEFNCP
jgi:8-amino-7-oxononanoate synthase